MPEDRFAHAMDTLDFAGVLRLVADRCVNEAARDAIMSLSPSTDPAWVDGAHADVAELRAYREAHGDVSIADVGYAPLLDDIAARRVTATPLDLLAIASGERAAAETSRQVETAAESHPRLAAIAAPIEPQQVLIDRVFAAIHPDGEIRDDATPALKRIRREIQGLKSSLRGLTEKLMGEFGGDTLSTVVGERHVLIVPRAKVRRQNGIVHSTSHSGESLYYEPTKLLTANNDLETHYADERAEVARILAELGDLVRDNAPAIARNAEVMTTLDALRARAIFSESFHCHSPSRSSGRIRLSAARHPRLQRILEEKPRGHQLVPLTLELDPAARLMVITGPNAGGKTVTIKTLGVAALLFQCGIPVPCDGGSELPLFERVLVDIGDEQSIESSLSTFTSHLRHLDEMARKADAHSLCLIDEIGDGTDPDEGAALAIATLERLLETRAAVVATTHYGRIKTFALKTDGVSNASMAFEDDEGRPLFKLLQGVAGRSRGLETARRAGFDDAVVRRAEDFIGDEAFKLESVLGELERSHLALERERTEVAEQSAELRRLQESYVAKAAEYNLTRKQAHRQAMREAEGLLVEARREIEQTVKEIRERKADKPVIRESRDRIEKRLQEVRESLREPSEQPRLESVAVGDRVALGKSGHPSGIVLEVDGGVATVEINDKRIRIGVERLFAPSPDEESQRDFVTVDASFAPLESTQLDVRGEDREATLGALMKFIDRAVLAGVHEVTIIHGVGTGVLARAVREYVQGDPRVESFQPGEPASGGAGVTIVRLK